MRSIISFVLLFFMGWATCTAGQEMSKRLTNQDIIDMVNMGISDDLIIAKIRSVNRREGLAFDTGVEGLKALKAAKFPDDVIKVMINPAPPLVSVGQPATSGDPNPNLPPPEVGVYWKDGATFVPIEGQALSQAKVGGRAGSMLTYGMRSEHWDAYLAGPTSKNRMKDRQPPFYIYVPDGTSAADFVLIKSEKKSNRREFLRRLVRRPRGGQVGRQGGKGNSFQV